MVKSLHPLGTLASRIELPPESFLDVRHAANGAASGNGEAKVRSAPPIVDPEKTTLEALRAPLNFPALAQGIVPGDHLAIAVGEPVPGVVRVVAGAIRAAEESGIEREAITVVAGEANLAQLLRDSLSKEFGGAVKFLVHDADDQENLCMVGQTHKKEALLFNRTLFEADVVLPIGCARLDDPAGIRSVYDSLFPWFCDAEMIGRMRTPSQRETAARRAAMRRVTDEAGWLLGAPLVVEVVPGGDDAVVDVVAGEPAAVAERCQEICERLWSFQVPRRASLVIATITGGRPEQNWDNIGRALAAVEHVVSEDGAVAICSDLELPPGPALGRLVNNSDWATVERDVRNDHAPDSWPAWQLARALQRGPVYFYSQLESDVVEDMGLAPIDDLHAINRLIGHHDSCILLDDSQYAVASVAGES